MGTDLTAVFITGASSGIGGALARHYAQRGVAVGALARRQDALDALAREFPGLIHCFAVDINNHAAVADAATSFMARVGVPNIVIANAGISAGGRAGSDLSLLKKILGVNVLGLAATLQPFVAPMLARGSGKLVGIASIAGQRGLPTSGAYCASKAAVQRYLEAMSAELYGSGVAALCILPGFVRTPMTAANPYPMLFRLDADDAARRIARAVARGRPTTIIPWQMAILGRLWPWVPGRLYNIVMRRALRKFGGKPLFAEETPSGHDSGSDGR